MHCLDNNEKDKLIQLIRNRVFLMSRAKMSIQETMHLTPDEIEEMADFLRTEFSDEED